MERGDARAMSKGVIKIPSAANSWHAGSFLLGLMGAVAAGSTDAV
jgi:hypothetical protein